VTLATPDKVENTISQIIPYDAFPTNINFYTQLINELVEMAKQTNGVGLSAIQVGIPMKLFVAYHYEDKVWKAYFNAAYCPVSQSRTYNAMEGCLTYPKEQYVLQRFDAVYFEWDKLTADQKLERKSHIVLNETGQVLQHETDHGNGITIKMIGMKVA
jgi:peptide deformylase